MSTEGTKPLVRHQFSDTLGLVKRGEKGKLSSVCFRDLVHSELVGKCISEFGFLIRYFVSNMDFESCVTFVTDVVPPDKMRIFLGWRTSC